MEITQSPMVCRSCGHEWLQETLSGVVIDVWVAHLRSVRCPKCNSDYRSIAFRLVPVDKTRHKP